MREHESMEAELHRAKELTLKEEHKYDVLQGETAELTREFLKNTMVLEGEVDKLRNSPGLPE